MSLNLSRFRREISQEDYEASVTKTSERIQAMLEKSMRSVLRPNASVGNAQLVNHPVARVYTPESYFTGLQQGLKLSEAAIEYALTALTEGRVADAEQLLRDSLAE